MTGPLKRSLPIDLVHRKPVMFVGLSFVGALSWLLLICSACFPRVTSGSMFSKGGEPLVFGCGIAAVILARRAYLHRSRLLIDSSGVRVEVRGFTHSFGWERLGSVRHVMADGVRLATVIQRTREAEVLTSRPRLNLGEFGLGVEEFKALLDLGVERWATPVGD